jgi:hypothetical protein
VTTNRSDRFRALSELFDEVVDLEGDAREHIIRERCATDAELEAELRRLLAADAGGESDGFVVGVSS